MSNLNFNSVTPAAPGGSTNVQWQADGNGNISAYVPTTTTIWTGTGNPNGSFTSGQAGDFFLDSSSATLYGPKSGSSTWPAVGVIGGSSSTNITVNGQPAP